MELDVRPEPEPEEREAIARALAETARPPAAPERTAWWREGVRENVDAAPDPERPT
jgi:hypothetical protein